MSVTMDEHDDLDDWPELRQLRELHQSDRMPSRVRERVLLRAEQPPTGSPRERSDAAAVNPGSSTGPLPVRDAHRDATPHRHATQPALPRRPRRGWLVAAGGAGLSAAAAIALWLTLPAGPSAFEPVAFESEHPAPRELAARPYTAEELGALGVQPGVSEVQVVGRLVSGTLTRLPALPPNQRLHCGYHFHLRPPGVNSGDGIHVEYGRCSAPDDLIDDGASCVEVSAVGVMRSDGHLDAKRITPRLVTPCP